MKCIARLRSRRVIQDHLLRSSNEAAVGGGCCWANLPRELLWEVLLRIEDSESSWPQRKNVVACAGVCRSWRIIIKQIVKVPQLSGKLTFPISVKQPGPKDSILQCFIKRNRSTQTYYLYLGLTNCKLFFFFYMNWMSFHSTTKLELDESFHSSTKLD
ncbi:tubby-like F-box protein 3 [Hibiscus syriacus]|uniref:tubby-like F-box protein 3 n=1 Tax=Hibiscus syriacus TaxID=106335 RepID=UPI00192354DF|nr:tubby-like F-box protein 3 [Hibiscus syriacus]